MSQLDSLPFLNDLNDIKENYAVLLISCFYLVCAITNKDN